MLKQRTLFAVLAFLSITFITACTHKVQIDNSVNVELKGNVKGLDPVGASDLYSSFAISVVYESLYQYNYLKRPLELEPLLAEAMPSVSKDGLTYTIKIKKGVKFADDAAFPNGKGRELTSQDFVYSWKRLADPSTQSEGFWVFDGRIKGLNEWREEAAKGQAKYSAPIEGFETPDNYTLIIKLKKPYYQLMYQLASTYTAAVPHEVVEKYGKEFLNHAIGTGPYILKEWIRNSRLAFERNPNWRGEKYPSEGSPGDKEAGLLEDAGKPIPFADKVVFYELPEDQPRWLKFMKGDTDFVEIPKDNYDGAVKDKKVIPELAAKGVGLRADPDPDLVYIGINMMDPVLGKNTLLRQAMAMAYDSDTYIQKFYNGRAINAQSIIPPGVDGYDPEYKNPYKQNNVEKAKELLKKAGYPDGKGLPAFEYNCSSGATDRQIGEYFQQKMAAIGIKITIQQNSWSQFIQRQKEKKVQIFGVAWGADYPDAENFLQLLYGPNESPGSNSSNFHNKVYDKLYDDASKLPPGSARTAIYKKMRDISATELPIIPDANRVRYQLYHGWIKNFKPHLTILNSYKYMHVDMDKKKELKGKL